MTEHDLFQERIVRVERPSQHFALLRSQTGSYLATADGHTLGMLAYVDDAAVWQRTELDYEHVATGLSVIVESDHDDSVCVPIADQSEQATRFDPVHGPAHLPSEYLRDFRATGWVGLQNHAWDQRPNSIVCSVSRISFQLLRWLCSCDPNMVVPKSDALSLTSVQ